LRGDTSKNRGTSGPRHPLFSGNGERGYQDGYGNNSKFNGPTVIAVHNNADLFIVDCTNNRIRKLSSSGVVSTIAGKIFLFF